MVREDDTEGRLQRQKSAGLGPATLDLNATEVAHESKSSSTETPAEPAEPGIAPLDASAPVAQSGEGETVKPQETAAAPPPPEPPAADRSSSEIPSPQLEAYDPPPPPRSSLPVVLAAVVGGIIGGGLVLAAVAYDLIPLGRTGVGAEVLVPRLTAAEQDIASNKAAIDQALGKVATVEVAAKTAQDAANNALNLAGDAQKAASAASSAGSTANEAPAAPPATVPDLSSITDRLGKSDAEIAALTDRLGKAETDVATLNDAMRQVGTATGSLSQQIADLKTAVANTPDKAAAYAVALSQLGEAVRSGKPFAAELNTAKALGGNAEALAPLASLAQTGTPSVEALAGSYEAVKPQIVAALTPKPADPPPDASMLDRLTSSLSGIVTTTPEGDVPAGDPGWPAQKVADALHKGDLPGAIAAFKAMPEAAQQAGAAWLSQASGAASAFDLIKAQTSAALQKFTGQ
ncbi:hypothetical protein GCM10007874_39260 [Labrys miyagiensis]|uniref:Phage tail protein n=1 Tax=Labrys miyagiensis TaxID=346912 RepID=A0ABQ6CQC9_9HYPH|nr:hypothetical protein [Labrys miyagiensis]GLS20909.1 hypothetical protein GCM10007874_39260 [Labrys miyagiensis]